MRYLMFVCNDAEPDAGAETPGEIEAWLEAQRAGAGGEAPATPQRPPDGVVSLTPATPKYQEETNA